MFTAISNAYAQTAQTVTDAANKVTEVASSNWEYAAWIAGAAIVGGLFYKFVLSSRA